MNQQINRSLTGELTGILTSAEAGLDFYPSLDLPPYAQLAESIAFIRLFQQYGKGQLAFLSAYELASFIRSNILKGSIPGTTSLETFKRLSPTEKETII